MNLLLAGETHTADKQINVDGWRLSAANTMIQDADDFTLVHWCAHCAGRQILVTLPADYHPRLRGCSGDAPGPHLWITRCVGAGVLPSRKSTQAPLCMSTLKIQGFTGSMTEISDYTDRDFDNVPHLFDQVW